MKPGSLYAVLGGFAGALAFLWGFQDWLKAEQSLDLGLVGMSANQSMTGFSPPGAGIAVIGLAAAAAFVAFLSVFEHRPVPSVAFALAAAGAVTMVGIVVGRDGAKAEFAMSEVSLPVNLPIPVPSGLLDGRFEATFRVQPAAYLMLATLLAEALFLLAAWWVTTNSAPPVPSAVIDPGGPPVQYPTHGLGTPAIPVAGEPEDWRRPPDTPTTSPYPPLA